MSFKKILPFQRSRYDGMYNVTYRNGTFRMNKETAEEIGFPKALEISVDEDGSQRVLLTPTTEENPDAFHTTSMGKSSWPNAFTSIELARRLDLPERNQTVRLYTEYDKNHKGLIMHGQRRQTQPVTMSNSPKPRRHKPASD